MNFFACEFKSLMRKFLHIEPQGSSIQKNSRRKFLSNDQILLTYTLCIYLFHVVHIYIIICRSLQSLFIKFSVLLNHNIIAIHNRVHKIFFMKTIRILEREKKTTWLKIILEFPWKWLRKLEKFKLVLRRMSKNKLVWFVWRETLIELSN